METNQLDNYFQHARQGLGRIAVGNDRVVLLTEADENLLRDATLDLPIEKETNNLQPLPEKISFIDIDDWKPVFEFSTYRQIIKYSHLSSRKTSWVNQNRSKNINCPHTYARHYARGMCSRCYNLNGRTKLATNCEHRDRPTYAKAMCQVCY